MKRKHLLWVTVLLAVLNLFVYTASACEFLFSYEQITAPIGTVGEIGVRVQKTHPRCTMDDPLDYQFTWEHLQILGETEWQVVGPELYEKWFKVSLSTLGEGFLKISKDCTKEGYEEAILPVTVTADEEDGFWAQAFTGVYPFEQPNGDCIESTIGTFQVDGETLKVVDIAVQLPFVPSNLADYSGGVRLFTMESEGQTIPLLLMSEDFFFRFDHFMTKPM